jgi:hypothetical protein
MGIHLDFTAFFVADTRLRIAFERLSFGKGIHSTVWRFY